MCEFVANVRRAMSASGDRLWKWVFCIFFAGWRLGGVEIGWLMWGVWWLVCFGAAGDVGSGATLGLLRFRISVQCACGCLIVGAGFRRW